MAHPDLSAHTDRKTGDRGADRGCPPGVDRRDFLQWTACALAAGGLGGCASLATVPVQSRGGVVRLPVRNFPELDDPRGALRIQPTELDRHLIVLAQEDGGFVVLSPVCTHRQCVVEVAGARIVCPCHGSEYDRSGQVLMGPAERPLTRYPAELNPEGELVIRMEAA